MKYIVEGRALAKLLQENRIRVQRGDLKFTPLAGDGEEAKPVVDTTSEDKVADVDKVVEDKEEPVVEDSKDVEPEADVKKPARKAKK